MVRIQQKIIECGMKKSVASLSTAAIALIGAMLIFCCISCDNKNKNSHPEQWYKATSYSFTSADSEGNWSDWTEWQSCNVNILLDTDEGVLVIYSNETQTYDIIAYRGKKRDASGGTQAYFDVIDQDGDKGTIRARLERNGNSQIYCEFANVMWVYNVHSQSGKQEY